MNYEEIISSEKVVLVEFYASWCPHCRRMAPVVDDIKKLVAGRVPVYQYDIDQNSELADSVKIETVPTFIVYRDGKEMWRYSGEIGGDALLGKIESFL